MKHRNPCLPLPSILNDYLNISENDVLKLRHYMINHLFNNTYYCISITWVDLKSLIWLQCNKNNIQTKFHVLIKKTQFIKIFIIAIKKVPKYSRFNNCKHMFLWHIHTIFCKCKYLPYWYQLPNVRCTPMWIFRIYNSILISYFLHWISTAVLH